MKAPAAAKYSWSAVPLEQLNPTLSRRVVTGKEMMIAHVYLKAGSIVPKHHHVNSVVVAKGEVLVIPSNVPHRAVALEDTLDVDVFAPPREDWLSGTDDYLRQK